MVEASGGLEVSRVAGVWAGRSWNGQEGCGKTSGPHHATPTVITRGTVPWDPMGKIVLGRFWLITLPPLGLERQGMAQNKTMGPCAHLQGAA